ncbi:MAG: hypothetical protein GKS01_00490 [Alphaproteobacteria bacterium]|nr:hypothetical protein [Alphaproteobacteria bacterium]
MTEEERIELLRDLKKIEYKTKELDHRLKLIIKEEDSQESEISKLSNLLESKIISILKRTLPTDINYRKNSDSYLKQEEISPPKILELAICCFLPKRDRGIVLGDLEEDYKYFIIPKFGKNAAKFWYFVQVLISITPLLMGLIERICNVLRKIIPFAGK